MYVLEITSLTYDLQHNMRRVCVSVCRSAGSLNDAVEQNCFHTYPTLYRGCLEAISPTTPTGGSTDGMKQYLQRAKGMQGMINTLNAVFIANRKVTSHRVERLGKELTDVLTVPSVKAVSPEDEATLRDNAKVGHRRVIRGFRCTDRLCAPWKRRCSSKSDGHCMIRLAGQALC